MSNDTDKITFIPFINNISKSSLKIKMGRKQPDGEYIWGPIGTGFPWLYGRDIYLITNWHNITGYNPITGAPLDSNYGFTPDTISVPIWRSTKVDDGTVIMEERDVLVALRDAHGAPVWFEHPQHGRGVDVVVLWICELEDELINFPLNSYPFRDIDRYVGDDAFVVGYPLGLDGGYGLPIWKKASIATESDIDIDGLPKLLIDTATRKGMSGSPVIIHKQGFAFGRGDTLEEKFKNGAFGGDFAFLGVYSGRVDDDNLGAQIGTVWKHHVITDILNAKTPGRGPYDYD